MASSLIDAPPRLSAGVFGYAHSAAARRPMSWQRPSITSWADFDELVALPGRPLLARLDDFEDSLLVAGCAGSGTTAIARLFKRTDGLADHAFGHDDELDGALLLAGYVERFDDRRHCFQTSYLGDRFREYFEHPDFRLVWIVREPATVVSAMLNAWKRAALDRLLPPGGGRPYPETTGRSLSSGVSRLDRACAAYAESIARTFEIAARLGPRAAIVDYDELAAHRAQLLPQLCAFAGTPFDRRHLCHLHGKSVHTAHTLAKWEAARVAELAAPAYRRARALCTIGAAHGL
ncbi:MAG TPA: hypothetical protein VFX89_22690 [Gammaproteobacteria bacterium]|nr:hypothetical protein [Gammaproteobacteria bacterium]